MLGWWICRSACSGFQFVIAIDGYSRHTKSLFDDIVSQTLTFVKHAIALRGEKVMCHII